MKCKDREKYLELILTDTISDDERMAVEKHLQACSQCRSVIQKTKEDKQRIKDILMPSGFPKRLEEKIIRTVLERGEIPTGKEQLQRFSRLGLMSFSLVAVLLMGLVFWLLFAGSQNRVLDGTLCVEGLGDRGWVLKINDSLPLGQLLKTSAGQSARIKLRDGSVLEMMPGTVLTLNNDRVLNLEEGGLNCQVAKGGDFSINMPGAELKTLGTGFNIRMSTNRKEIITSQGNPLSFITSATVKVAVSSGRISLTTEQKHKRLQQEVGAGETVIREIDPPLPVELQTEIKDLIQRLDSENKVLQEKAFGALLKIGYVIVPFLEEACVNAPTEYRGVYKLLARFPRPEILWSHEIQQVSLALHPPVVSDNQVYIVSESGLSAIDCFTGSVNWELKQDGFNSAPLVGEDGIIYIGTLGGCCFAIETKKGKITWQQNGLGLIQSTPTLCNKILYFGSGEAGTNRGKFYALDARTGKVKWYFLTEGMIACCQAAVFNDEIVLFGTWDNKLYALDARTGEKRWDYQTNGKIVTFPIVANELVYVGSWEGKLHVLSVHNGQEHWSFQADSPIIESPAKEGKIIYWGTQHKIYAFDLERRNVIWTYNRERYVPGTILVKDKRIYLGTDSGRLVVLNLIRGEKEWDFEMPYGDVPQQLVYYNIASCSSMFDDIIYISSRLINIGDTTTKTYALKLR